MEVQDLAFYFIHQIASNSGNKIPEHVSANRRIIWVFPPLDSTGNSPTSCSSVCELRELLGLTLPENIFIIQVKYPKKSSQAPPVPHLLLPSRYINMEGVTNTSEETVLFIFVLGSK